MPYNALIKVRFSDVDNAGIGYYPKIVHFLHVAFEDFFDNAVGVPYADLLVGRRIGFPSVHLETDFKHPLHFGDLVSVAVFIDKLGSSSATFRYEIRRAPDQPVAVDAKVVVVAMDLKEMKTLPIPDDLRERFERYQQNQGS